MQQREFAVQVIVHRDKFLKYIRRFKSSAHCASAVSRMTIVLIIATVVSQTSIKKNVCILAGYVVPVLQKTEP